MHLWELKIYLTQTLEDEKKKEKKKEVYLGVLTTVVQGVEQDNDY